MPHLVCRTCGRRIYSVAPLSSMAADERRCPRCGSPFYEDRRGPERRVAIRRENPPADPGPPADPTAGDAPPDEGDSKAKGAGKKAKGAAAEPLERRGTDRRSAQRRGGRPALPPGADPSGWRD